MFDFQQKNKLRKFFYSPVVVGILALVSLYSLYSTWSVYYKMAKSGKDLEKSQKQYYALVAKNTQLDTEINDLQTNEGVEREIRSKFGVAKSDESIAVIVSDSNSSTSTNDNKASFWTRFRQFFGF